MKWPANSPDLNPIETFWDDMKDYIEDHYPDCHRFYKKLKAAVLEAWEFITIERIKELVYSMRGRCFAVAALQKMTPVFWKIRPGNEVKDCTT